MRTERKFDQCNFVLSLLSFLLYLTDIGTDLWVAAVYLRDGHPVRCLLVLSVIVVSALVLQSFSWSWYKDDQDQSNAIPEHLYPHHRGCSWLCLLHIFQMGVLVRFIMALIYGYKAAFKKEETPLKAIYAVTDLSMLRLFETFLEAAPQLVLQVFILLMFEDREYIQYVSVILSSMNISWATLDYYAALKNSLIDQPKLTCGFAYLFYFFYKLLTLNAKVLLVTLLAMINIIAFVVYFCVLWLIMFICVCVQKTKFCTSKIQEFIYRAVVAFILVFTFFNLKSKNTRVVATLYYTFRIVETVVILFVCWFLKSSTVAKSYSFLLSLIIVPSLIAGIVCLVLYYSCYHPKRAYVEESNHSKNSINLDRSCDEIDGPSPERLNNANQNTIMINSIGTEPEIINDRITHFLSF
ncbi:XK-related protein 9 [Narcine bancroftii]|uniref:XK-related protein 9 n=1 Tax=Narcine bancroftii TaxID=1343680 RepID=UPI003831611D